MQAEAGRRGSRPEVGILAALSVTWGEATNNIHQPLSESEKRHFSKYGRFPHGESVSSDVIIYRVFWFGVCALTVERVGPSLPLAIMLVQPQKTTPSSLGNHSRIKEEPLEPVLLWLIPVSSIMGLPGIRIEIFPPPKNVFCNRKSPT